MSEQQISGDRTMLVQLQPAEPSLDQTTVVILGARDERRLRWLERRLVQAGVPHVVIREPDAPYYGSLMAIGLVPGVKANLYIHVRDFQVLNFMGAPVAVRHGASASKRGPGPHAPANPAIMAG